MRQMLNMMKNRPDLKSKNMWLEGRTVEMHPTRHSRVFFGKKSKYNHSCNNLGPAKMQAAGQDVTQESFGLEEFEI